MVCASGSRAALSLRRVRCAAAASAGLQDCALCPIGQHGLHSSGRRGVDKLIICAAWKQACMHPSRPQINHAYFHQPILCLQAEGPCTRYYLGSQSDICVAHAELHLLPLVVLQAQEADEEGGEEEEAQQQPAAKRPRACMPCCTLCMRASTLLAAAPPALLCRWPWLFPAAPAAACTCPSWGTCP
jgi:hypothetical protein